MDPFDSVEAVVAAAALASARWGGATYLLLPEPLTERAKEFAANLGVDVLASIPGMTRPPLEVPAEFEFRSFPRSDPFDKGDGTLHNEVLRMQSLAETVVAGATSAPQPDVRWSPEHPLASLLAVLFGVKETAPADAVFETPLGSQTIDLGIDGPMPPGAQEEGLLQATLVALKQRRPANYRGIVLMDPTVPDDLVGFWNLRATGADVVAYVPEHHELVKDYVSAWVATQQELDATHAIHIWSRTNAVPVGLHELCDVGDRPLFVEELAAVPVWAFAIPIESHFSENFEVSFDADDWSIDVPLPRVDLLPPASWYERFGTVAAEIEVSGERDLPAGRALKVPLSRSLGTKFLRQWASPGLTPFLRSSMDGVVAGVDVRATKVSVPLVGSLPLIASVFEAAGLEVKRSDAGLYCERIIEMFGGVQADGIALHPAIRSVLHKATQSPFGSAVQTLVATAKRDQGSWPDSIFGRHRDYPAWVIQWLCDKNFLQARLKTKCPNCGNGLSIAPADLADDIACPLCGKSRTLALHLSALKPQWRLALRRHLQAERLAETMPVLASLSMLAHGPGYTSESLHHAVGIRVTGEVDCELDLIVATRERESPVLVIGECKSYRDSISPTDVANLVAVQDRFAAAGVECYVLYATLRERFAPDEVAAIRGSTEALRSTGAFRSRQALEPIAPIALDGRSLSTHSFSEESLFRVQQGPTTLSSLGLASCQRNLGLKSAELDTQDPDRYITSWEPLASA